MKFEKKIDFAALVSVTNANPNGDPFNGNRPRTDYKGIGEMTDVCIKRKIRNRLQDMGQEIFVQSDDRRSDACISLKDRAKFLEKIKQQDEFARVACEKWLDVRAFGQVFTFKGFGCASVGVRGPVSIHQAVSVDPVDAYSVQITKSVSSERKNESERSNDTVGMKHFVRFGLYKIKGSVNVQLAEKTGFTCEDAQLIKEALRTLFVNDAAAARPDGSMEVIRVYWWEHNCKDGQHSSAKVHRLLHATLKSDVDTPASIDDYEIHLDTLPGLSCEELEGL